MDGHWFEYKDCTFNLEQVRRFSIDRYKKNDSVYTGDLDTSKMKSKPYVLYIDHEPVDHFKSKDEARNVIKAILAGKYNLK